MSWSFGVPNGRGNSWSSELSVSRETGSLSRTAMVSKFRDKDQLEKYKLETYKGGVIVS